MNDEIQNTSLKLRIRPQHFKYRHNLEKSNLQNISVLYLEVAFSNKLLLIWDGLFVFSALPDPVFK